MTGTLTPHDRAIANITDAARAVVSANDVNDSALQNATWDLRARLAELDALNAEAEQRRADIRRIADEYCPDVSSRECPECGQRRLMVAIAGGWPGRYPRLVCDNSECGWQEDTS